MQTKNGPKKVSGGQADHYPETWESVRGKLQSGPEKPTRGEVIDKYNDTLGRWICKRCNEGHKFEGKAGVMMTPANDNAGGGAQSR